MRTAEAPKEPIKKRLSIAETGSHRWLIATSPIPIKLLRADHKIQLKLCSGGRFPCPRMRFIYELKFIMRLNGWLDYTALHRVCLADSATI